MKVITRVAVVEDSSKVRRNIVDALNAHQSWRVVVECANAASALREIPGARPGLVLLDIMLPDHSGIELISPLKAALPQVPIVMLTVVERAADIVRAVRSGACGYIIKKDSADLTSHVEDVLAGRAPVMSPSVARHLWRLAESSHLGVTQQISGLTPREWEVLRLATRGRQQGEIAAELGISVNTVKIHRRKIYEKLGVHSPMEALVKFNASRGLLDDR